MIRRSLISVLISSLELQGLLMSVIRPADTPTKLPVQRKLDFESHIDVQRFDDNESDDKYMIPCGQVSPPGEAGGCLEWNVFKRWLDEV